MLFRADDILKARLDTPGILEHAFVSEVEHEANEEIIEWKFFDVGGARTQRLAWAPYFEDGKSESITLNRLKSQQRSPFLTCGSSKYNYIPRPTF